MTHSISIYKALCATSEFVINGIDANSDDFGWQGDVNPENAEDYCCANMRFIPRQETKEILRKYSIDKEEYDEICEKLEDGLSFGSCGWCS
jgi:hypothetical protein